MRRLGLLLVWVVLAGVPQMARAQFAVFDAANVAQTIKNVGVGIQTYQQVMALWQLSQQAAQNIKNLPGQFPTALMSQWAPLNPANACIACGSWTTAANTGAAPSPTYGGAIGTLSDPSQVLSLMTPQAQAALQAKLANSLYLPDAAARADLAALGQVRGMDPQLQQYVDQCRANATDGGLISQVQTTQAGSSCAAVLAQQNTNTNVLVGRLVEDASIRKAREMNASTEIINTEISHARTFNDVPRTTTGIDASVRQMYENVVR